MTQKPQEPIRPAAQRHYADYVQLHRAGKEREGRSSLQQAADAGHPSALFRLAIIKLEGLEDERDVVSGMENLVTAAATGHIASRRMLGVLRARGVGASPDWQSAIEDLVAMAGEGDANALRDLGLLLQMKSPGHALSNDLLFRAACRDDGLATYALLCRVAAGTAQFLPAVTAYWQAALKRLNHPRLFRLPAASADPRSPELPKPLDIGVLADVRTLLNDLSPSVPELRQISPQPRIFALSGLLSLEECEFLIGLGAAFAHRAKVYNNVTGRLEEDPVRTCAEAVFWPSNQTLVGHCLNLRMAAAAQSQSSKAEQLRLLVYQPGDEFRAHYDFFSNTEMVPDFRVSGQRDRTLLTYLNDDYAGGETNFAKIGYKHSAGAGDALLFFNTDAAGVPDSSTLHAGVAVTRGTKWLASQWYRERSRVD